MRWLHRFYLEENGATAVEYALLVGLIAMVILASVNRMFNSLHDPFGKVNAPLTP